MLYTKTAINTIVMFMKPCVAGEGVSSLKQRVQRSVLEARQKEKSGRRLKHKFVRLTLFFDDDNDND